MKNILVVALFWGISFQVFCQIELFELKTEYADRPMALDIAKPRFSWKVKSKKDENNLKQQAYQIEVKDETGKIVWNSGKTLSDENFGIYYEGSPLVPKTHYDFTIHLWDNIGRETQSSSFFETGLMGSGWGAAEWIGSNNLPFYSDYQSVYILEANVQIKNNGKASILFGANDPRLLDKNKNIMGVENPHGKSYVEVELNLNPLKNNQVAELIIYRSGYSQQDNPNNAFAKFEIPFNLINPKNSNLKHQLIIACNFGMFEFFIDQKDSEHLINKPVKSASPFAPKGLNLNPVGAGNNFISFPMVNEIGYKVAAGNQVIFDSYRVKNYRRPNNLLFDAGNKKLEISPKNETYFKTFNPSQHSIPYLRTTFNLENKKIRKARLIATARGIYELYLNGQKVDNDYFKPGLTQYNLHHEYQSFDVTDKIQAGENVWGTILAEGWWSGNITYSGENWNFFGDRSSFIGNLEIEFEDGSKKSIPTKADQWKSYQDGPIIVGSFFQGEVYDARKEKNIEAWAKPGFKDQDWKKAEIIQLKNTAWLEETSTDPRDRGLDYSNLEFKGQLDPGVHILTTLKPIKLLQPRDKVFIYDMGQNMVGFPRISIKNGKPGQKITLRYAEVLYPNLPEHKGLEGMIMLENIRAALVQDEYILKGGDEIIQPRFTFHGFRYLEITGIESPISREDITGIVISSIDGITANFESSDPLVNKLWENITWSLRGNFLSIPTDTPARNERMGWSGDINVFSKSANYLAEINNFMRKHSLAMRDLQSAEGRFPDVAPVGGGFGGTLWGSAGIIVPWETYQKNGDLELLKEHYPAMKKYLAYLETKENSEGILLEGPLGDWLSPEVNTNDNTAFWMAYQAYDYSILEQSARILGKTDEANVYLEKYQNKVNQINKIYFDKEGKSVHSGEKTMRLGPPSSKGNEEDMTRKGYQIDTQASYAIPLNLGVIHQDIKDQVTNHLLSTINRENKDDLGRTVPPFSLMTGFIGTASINEALSKTGRDDYAYQLLVSKNYPSWLYPVINGATTIWERLNSYTIQDGFGGNNSMNSFNHYSFGAVAGWMVEYMLGIRREEGFPGYKQFILNPRVDETGNIAYVQGKIMTMQGEIVSKWRKSNNQIIYQFNIPFNAQAKVILEKKNWKKISRNGKIIDLTNGILSKQEDKDQVILICGSGNYQFELE